MAKCGDDCDKSSLSAFVSCFSVVSDDIGCDFVGIGDYSGSTHGACSDGGYVIVVFIAFVVNLLFTTIAIIIFVFIVSDVVLVFKTGGESELV